MRDWALGTQGKWVTMGVPSNGDYGIPKDIMFGFPVTTEGGKYTVVQGLPIDAFSQERINKTLKELQDEQPAWRICSETARRMLNERGRAVSRREGPVQGWRSTHGAKRGGQA